MRPQVGGVTENEEEEDNGYNEACDDNQKSVLDSTNVATGLNGSGVALGSVRLLSFHNLIVLLKFEFVNNDSFFLFDVGR